MLKKLIAAILAVLLLSFMSACAYSVDNSKDSIVVTTYPIYDWLINILGESKDNFNITVLNDNGVDLHSYQATADDIVAIKTSKLFIYTGGESDKWADEIISSSASETRIDLKLIDALGEYALEEKEIEGMQTSDEEEEEDALDEHIWLSLKNVQHLCLAICKSLCEKYPSDSPTFTANCNEYIEQLKELDSEYTEKFSNTEYDTVLFCDRFPFAYLCNDYGINYYAAFSGCSAESEASFETISFLADKINELDLKYVFVLERSDCKISNTVISTAGKNCETLVLDSMQSINANELDTDFSYYAIMKNNLETLLRGLN